MSRARKLGALATALACAGLVAGCGGGGYTAAEEAPNASPPATTTPAPATAAPATGASAAGSPTSAIGTLSPADPSSGDQSIKGYDRFPRGRAGTIFVDPTKKAEPATSTTPASTDSPVTAVPTSPTSPTAPTAPTAPTTPSSAPAPTPVSTVLVASLDVNGVVQTSKVGDQVPASSPQFTIDAITDTKVTLKPLSGTLPGGATTQDITVGQSVTLNNATTGASLIIKVVEIKAQA
jgi:hypothetical protein